jgi:hypothetical protein
MTTEMIEELLAEVDVLILKMKKIEVNGWVMEKLPSGRTLRKVDLQLPGGDSLVISLYRKTDDSTKNGTTDETHSGRTNKPSSRPPEDII